MSGRKIDEVLAKYAEGSADFNENVYGAIRNREKKSKIFGTIAGLGGIGAGIATGNPLWAISGTALGAAGVLGGMKAKKDADLYQDSAEYRKRVNSPGLFNDYNDVAIGNKLGLPKWML